MQINKKSILNYCLFTDTELFNTYIVIMNYYIMPVSLGTLAGTFCTFLGEYPCLPKFPQKHPAAALAGKKVAV